MSDRRERIGSATSAVTRQLVYRTPNALEIDSLEWVEIRRTRVFYDDVLMVTFHRETGILYPLLLSLAAFMFGAIALAVAFSGAAGPSIFFFVVTLAFAVPVLVRLIAKLDIVTVYGRRSKARIQFPLRKARARQLYEEICEAARAAQPAPVVVAEEPVLTEFAPPPEQ